MRVTPLILLLAAIFLTVGHGCSEGSLDIEFGNQEFNSNTPSNGSSTPDSGPAEDTATEDAEETPECCDPNQVECTGAEEYRFCDPVGDFCGHWTEPMDCPTDHVCDPSIEMDDPCDPLCTENHPNYGDSCTAGEGVCEAEGALTECDGDILVCDAVPGEPEPKACNGLDSNCDGEVDSEDVCERCVEDEFGPANHDYSGAPELAVGGLFANLVLCDNEAPPRSQNWFYLGETNNLHVHLEWDEADGPLGLEIRVVPEFGFPEKHADAGSGTSELTYQESLDEAREFYVVVYFETDDKPITGTPYEITRPD